MSEKVAKPKISDPHGWLSKKTELDEKPRWLSREPETVEILDAEFKEIEYTKTDPETGKEFPATKWEVQVLNKDGSKGYRWLNRFQFREVAGMFKEQAENGKMPQSVIYKHKGYD